jgi:hypothetical protein
MIAGAGAGDIGKMASNHQVLLGLTNDHNAGEWLALVWMPAFVCPLPLSRRLKGAGLHADLGGEHVRHGSASLV